MQEQAGLAAVAHVIQLALTPIFLLLGIGTMLAVMTNRLARIVDRARGLRREVGSSEQPSSGALRESATLTRRGTLISYSIALLTTAALLVSGVVAVLFAGASLGLDASLLVAILFIIAMAAVCVGLLLFLREIFLATAALRLGLDPVGTSRSPRS